MYIQTIQEQKTLDCYSLHKFLKVSLVPKPTEMLANISFLDDMEI